MEVPLFAKWIQYAFPDSFIIEGILNIPIHTHAALPVADFGGVVETINPSADDFPARLPEHLGQLVGKDRLAGCTRPVNPNPQGVGLPY